MKPKPYVTGDEFVGRRVQVTAGACKGRRGKVVDYDVRTGHTWVRLSWSRRVINSRNNIFRPR